MDRTKKIEKMIDELIVELVGYISTDLKSDFEELERQVAKVLKDMK